VIRRTPLKRTPWTYKRKPIKRSTAKHDEYQAEFLAAIEIVRARSGNRCEYYSIGDIDTRCKSRPAPYPHHRKLRSQGGTNDPDNLADLCPTHHRWVHDNPKLSKYDGWIVSSWEDYRVPPGVGV
jgi:hypothetical protein